MSRQPTDGAPSNEAMRPTPLSEPMYLILAVLADGPLHGYGILGELERRSAGEHEMLTGTLYNALRRLQSHGLVEARDAAEDAAEDADEVASRGARRTKQYRVTEAGLQSLQAEAQRMRALLRWTRADGMTDGLSPAMEEGR